MIVEKILGNIKHSIREENDYNVIDCVPVEWYEVHKKILHKVSKKGLQVGIRREEAIPLRDGDILWQDDRNLLVIEISECECLALKPVTMLEMAEACYAIGNKHAPLFIEGEELLTPYDEPLIKVLARCGLSSYKKNARLTRSIGGHAGGHVHSH